MERNGELCRRQWAGRFGVYGGRYVPETLMAALEELEARVRGGEGGCGDFRRSWMICCITTADGRLRFILRSG